MRKIKVCFLIFVLLVFAPFLSITSWAASGKPVVGVAWHNNPGETFIATCKAIEAVERPDKTFVLGLQYHPEIAVVRGLDESSIEYFRAIVSMAKQ